MKDLKSFLTESKTSYTVKGRTLEFTIDHNLSIPVMVANGYTREWVLRYIQALQEKDGSYGLYLQTMPGDNDKSTPINEEIDGLIPVVLFDFDTPKESQKYDFIDTLLGIGDHFSENQVITVKL